MIHIFYLSLAIILHELGHFVMAKHVKMEVEKFCLFIDWKRDLVNVTYKGTKYALGWIPIGGYIRIKDLFIYTLVKKKRMDKYKVLLSGGLTNILIFAIFIWTSKEFALFNLIVGVFNLMPLNKNDGYYIWKMLIDKQDYILKDGYFEPYFDRVYKLLKEKDLSVEMVIPYYKDGLSINDTVLRLKKDFADFY